MKDRMSDKIENTGTDKGDPKLIRFLNGWCQEHERLMSEWSDISLCYRWIHADSEKYYHSKSLWINLPVIILSTLGGTANFGVQSLFESDDTKKIASFAIGGISLFAGLLTTIGNYLRYAQLEESHRVASISWGKFQRRIAIEVALHPNERMDALDFLKVCRVELDRLIEQSPSIPKSSITKFTNKFGLIRDLKKPDICGQLEHTIVYDSSELRLKKLAQDASLVLNQKKSNIEELLSSHLEVTIRQEVDKQVEEALKRNRERLTTLYASEQSIYSKDINQSDKKLENIIVVPSSVDVEETQCYHTPPSSVSAISLEDVSSNSISEQETVRSTTSTPPLQRHIFGPTIHSSPPPAFPFKRKN